MRYYVCCAMTCVPAQYGVQRQHFRRQNVVVVVHIQILCVRQVVVFTTWILFVGILLFWCVAHRRPAYMCMSSFWFDVWEYGLFWQPLLVRECYTLLYQRHGAVTSCMRFMFFVWHKRTLSELQPPRAYCKSLDLSKTEARAISRLQNQDRSSCSC